MKTEEWIREQIALAEKQYEETENKPVMVTSKFLIKFNITILKHVLEEK